MSLATLLVILLVICRREFKSHTQQKLHWGNDDLDIATIVKLQIMKINTILSTEPVFMAVILALSPIM
jgi:hypothetical protein